MNSKFLKISAVIGIAFGVFLIFAETRRNWGAWGHWSNYTFDYLFAALLILSGVLCLRGKNYGWTLLVVTWAFTVAMFTYSFVDHIRSIDQPTYGPIPQVELTIWIGLLDALAAFALTVSLWPSLRRRA